MDEFWMNFFIGAGFYMAGILTGPVIKTLLANLNNSAKD